MGGVLWNIGAFVVALGLLVAVHEFGHFWVARRCGVKVERFSIGFGKAIWRRMGKDGTEYVLALIPLGGYVKMLDGRVDELKPGDEQYAFNHKSVLGADGDCRRRSHGQLRLCPVCPLADVYHRGAERQAGDR